MTLETAFKKIIPKTANLECLTNTPKRAAIAWKQNMENNKPLNLTTFKGQLGVVINQTNIPIDSVCEHHLLPFFGTAEVEYISNGLIIGLSKIEQLCNYICKGLHIQEDITEKISQHLSLLLKTDVTVKLSCEHTCMRRYGSQKGIVTNTIYKSNFNNTNNKII